MTLMTTLRQSIIDDRFEEYIKNFFLEMFPNKDYPTWCIDALDAVNMKLIT